MSEQDTLLPPDYFESRRRRRSRGGLGCFGWVAVMFITLVIAVTGALFYFGQPLRELAMRLVKMELVKDFFKTEVSSEHRDVILEISATHGDVLEVASPMKTTEIFRKSDVRHAAWGWVYLGTTTSEIKVPATYRFHIKLSELKNARLEDGILTVQSPPAEPSLPVAFDTSGMEKKADGTWLRFDADEQLKELEKKLTPELNARAARHLTTIREVARSDIAKFVQKWVVESNQSFRDQVKEVRIVFPGEDAANINPTTSALPEMVP